MAQNWPVNKSVESFSDTGRSLMVIFVTTATTDGSVKALSKKACENHLVKKPLDRSED